MSEFPGIITLLILFVATPFLIIPLSALRMVLTGNLPRSLVVLCIASAASLWLALISGLPIPFGLTPRQFVAIVTFGTALWLGSVLLGPKHLLWFDLLTAAAIVALVYAYLR
jgi:hypothetical protein